MDGQEQRRHRLSRKLEEVLGREEAETLMAQLPPYDWPQLATKQDLADLRNELRAELHSGIGGLRNELTAEMARWGRTHVYTTLAAVIASTSLAFAAAGLG